MKSIRIFVILPLLIIYSFSVIAQETNSDTVFLQFEKCMKSYYSEKYSKFDTALFCFYGSKYNISMHKKQTDGGAGIYYDFDFKNMIDSSNILGTSSLFFFDREISFSDFINNILVRKDKSGCIFRKEKKGIWLFINCPEESWQQFYFDKIIYNDTLYLTPSIDIIKSDGINIVHKREMLICRYTNNNGFLIEKAMTIRENKVCLK